MPKTKAYVTYFELTDFIMPASKNNIFEVHLDTDNKVVVLTDDINGDKQLVDNPYIRERAFTELAMDYLLLSGNNVQEVDVEDKKDLPTWEDMRGILND